MIGLQATAASAAILDEPLRVRYDSLKTVRDIESCLIQFEPITKVNQRLFIAMHRAEQAHATRRNLSGLSLQQGSQQRDVNRFEDCELEMVSYFDQSSHMLQKAEVVRGSITDTLNIKFQLTSQTLTRAAQHESIAIRVITLLTMFYLPFSFVAV